MRKYLAVILLCLLVSGCAGSAGKQGDDNILRLRLKEDPTTVDPALIVDVAGGAVAAKLYSGLVRFDDRAKIIPDIAESWDISPDGLAYTFRIRPGIVFSDGSPLTAGSIKRSFARVIEGSPRKWIFDKVKEIKIIDDATLLIEMKEPFAPFLGLLAMPNAYININGKMGSGPYLLKKWNHDRSLLLVPNPLYYGEPARVNGIEYRIIPEDFTALAEFDLGNIDIMELSPIQWRRAEGDRPQPGGGIYSQTGLNVYYIGLNCRKPLFSDVNLRRAFNYAIDKKVIIDNVLQGQAEPAGGPVPPVLLPAGASDPYSYSPGKAKRLLQGYKFTKPLKLYVKAQNQSIQIAEVIQHYLGRAGVPVKIVALEWSAFKKAVNEGETDMFLLSWWADYPDPENFLFPTFHSANIGPGGNRAYYQDKIVDSLIEQAQKELEADSRERLYEKLQVYINRQAPWIFLWHAKELILAQDRVKGFKLYPVYNSDKGTDVYLYN